MIIYYFGADSEWNEGEEKTIRRRNLAILLTLSKHPSVTKVYNVIRTTRDNIFKRPFANASNASKIETIFIAPILPERGLLNYISRPLNRFILKQMYSKLLKERSTTKRLAWCYWPKGFEDFSLFGLPIEMIFDTDHNIIDEPNSLVEQKYKRKNLLLQAGKRAKYILSSSRSMLEWYKNQGFTNYLLLMNGVFENRINLKPISTVSGNYTVTYAGTLSKWIKIDWLLQIIKEHEDWNFNFIGTNYNTEISTLLEAFPNVKLHGFLKPEKVDKFIKSSNVCIGLYQKDEALDVNSMKLYDYLAQGIPVVVNDYHPHLEKDFYGLLNIATNYADFKRFIEEPKSINLLEINNFLENSKWSHRIHKALQDTQL